MEERNDMDKIEEEMMPGFRFHPTDEEIVNFYLKRKIQQKPLPIELIKQVDIYKYEPWDLPKLASTGEKEWYFYCPRDRKYRNSARPNRVTRAGFWKATGTDRPIYSSEGKCIGLKKSLVFYRGRAAKGMKTDWMMHEFRLPCLSDSAGPLNKVSHNTLPATDSWAICRIFQKTNSMSMAQKALSHPWISHLPAGSMVSDMMITHCNHFTSSDNNNISCTTQVASPPPIQFSNANNNTNLSPRSDHMIPSYKPISSSSSTVSKSSQIPNNPVSDGDFSDNFVFYTLEATNSDPDCIGFHDEEPNQHHYNIGFSISVPHQDLQANTVLVEEEQEQGCRKNPCNPVQVNNWETTRFPFSLPPNVDAWNNKATTVPWDLPPPCPTEFSTSYSTNNKCYT